MNKLKISTGSQEGDISSQIKNTYFLFHFCKLCCYFKQGGFSDKQNLADIQPMSIKNHEIKKVIELQAFYQIYQNLLNLTNLIIILIRCSQNVNENLKMSLVYSNAY